jgi:hypothetical protein
LLLPQLPVKNFERSSDMRFPIDVRNLTFVAGSDPAGGMDIEGGQRSDKATGELLWG